MKILVSNDDGYRAQGLAALARAMAQLGEVSVVAPERNRSGASNSLTLEHPLRVQVGDNGYFYVDGTPTDGTVAAAVEGRFLGLPAIAVSLLGVEPQHYATAAEVAKRLVMRLQHQPLPADTILNVNVPDLSWQELAGFEATRLGHRHKSEPVIKSRDPRGREIYWVGAAGPEADAGPGTDFHAVCHGRVSITPLQVDLTRYSALETVASWVEGLEA
ncbi:MAG: 5'/3'-nucleotidase SurE [Gammaproteobacteria bacterium]